MPLAELEKGISLPVKASADLFRLLAGGDTLVAESQPRDTRFR
jgi:hypothetical protein